MRTLLETTVLMVGILGPQMVSAEEETRVRIVCVESGGSKVWQELVELVEVHPEQRTIVIDQLTTEYDDGSGIKHMQGNQFFPEGAVDADGRSPDFHGKSPLFEGRLRYFKGALVSDEALASIRIEKRGLGLTTMDGQLNLYVTPDEANAFIETATPEAGKTWDGKFGRLGSRFIFFNGKKETNPKYIYFDLNINSLKLGGLNEKGEFVFMITADETHTLGPDYIRFTSQNCMMPYIIPAQ